MNIALGVAFAIMSFVCVYFAMRFLNERHYWPALWMGLMALVSMCLTLLRIFP